MDHPENGVFRVQMDDLVSKDRRDYKECPDLLEETVTKD